jgi:trehalose 6-phosphate synthase
VLRTFAGAAEELNSAVLVNPFSEEDLAGGIHTALTLPCRERMSRMARLRSAVRNNDIHRWAASIFSAAAQAAGPGTSTPVALEPLPGAAATAEVAYS